MKEFEEVQVKVIEACEMTQTRVAKTVKEVNEKLEASRQFHEQRQLLEKNLCTSNGMNMSICENLKVALQRKEWIAFTSF